MSSILARGAAVGSVVVLLAAVAACVGSSDVSNGGASSSSSTSSGAATTTSSSSSSSGGDAAVDPDASSSSSSSSGELDAAVPDAAPDAGPGVPTPPLSEPDVWLDARFLPDVASTSTWLDSSPHEANAVAAAPHSINAFGRKSIVFDDTQFSPFSIPAAKLPNFRTDTGFTVIMVAGYSDRADRSSQAVMFAREVSVGTIGPDFTGIEMYLKGADAEVIDSAVLNVFSAAKRPTPTTVLTGASPSSNGNHVFVINIQNGTAKLRIDGAQLQSKTTSGTFTLADATPLVIGNYGGSNGTMSQFGFEGRMSLFTLYARQFTPEDITAAELKAKVDFGIP